MKKFVIKISATISVATVIAMFRILVNLTYQSESFTEMYMNVVYQDCSADSGLISMFIALLLPLSFLIVSSNYISNDINTAITYILPRSKTLSKYFTRKILFILKKSCEVVLFNNAIIFVFCAFKSNFTTNDISSVVISIIVQILFCFMTSLFVNVVSIAIGDKFSCFLGISAMVVLSGLINIFKENLTLSRLNPIYHYFIQWHNGSTLINTQYEITQYIKDLLPIEYSVLYMLLIVSVKMIVGILLLKNKDILIRRR